MRFPASSRSFKPVSPHNESGNVSRPKFDRSKYEALDSAAWRILLSAFSVGLRFCFGSDTVMKNSGTIPRVEQEYFRSSMMNTYRWRRDQDANNQKTASAAWSVSITSSKPNGLSSCSPGVPSDSECSPGNRATHDPRRIRNLNEVPSPERPCGSESPVPHCAHFGAFSR